MSYDDRAKATELLANMKDPAICTWPGKDEADIATALREAYEAGVDHAGDGIGGLLAIIHGDGGHYQHQHGTAKAITDAATKWYEMLAAATVPKGDGR